MILSYYIDFPIKTVGVTGFTWLTSPVCTELEMSVTDWLGRMVGLPDEFLFSKDKQGGGGGVIHGSASEANAFAVICARERIIRSALKVLT